jgi:hypothetical protein
MSKESIIFAKIAALKKSFENIKFFDRGRCLGSSLEPLLPRYKTLIDEVKSEMSELFSDLPELPMPKTLGQSGVGLIYAKMDIDPLVNNLDYILELRSNMRIGDKVENLEKKNRIFISHGQSKEWYKLQAYLERDIKQNTLELAQEPNVGRTIIQKLSEEAEKCSIAIIVMTGDDITSKDEIRARENVMHEIGFFQGLYGVSNVILLHEEGVNIPTNIQGLVYIPFPKETVEATFAALVRELKVLIN